MTTLGLITWLLPYLPEVWLSLYLFLFIQLNLYLKNVSFSLSGNTGGFEPKTSYYIPKLKSVSFKKVLQVISDIYLMGDYM